MTRRPDRTTVLVAVDGTNGALGALGWATEFAIAHGCTLRLVHVVPAIEWTRGFLSAVIHEEADLRGSQDAVARRVLAEASTLARAIAPSITVDEVVSADPLDKHVARWSHECRLVAVGAHRTSPIDIVAPGHAIATVTAAACPVLVWHDPVAVGRGDVVVGCDGSRRDVAAREAGTEMARHLGTGLVSVHFGRPSSGLQVDRGNSRVITVGDPSDPVTGLRVLSATAQMVVVGSHRRGRGRRAVLGSVSEPLVRSCACPVLVV